MNFVLAYFLFLIMAFIIGVPNYNSTIIGEVAENSPASNVLEPGDKIIAINGINISSWAGDNNSVTSVLDYLNSSYVFTVERDNKVLSLPGIEPQYVFMAWDSLHHQMQMN